MDLVQVELDDETLPGTPTRTRWSARAWARLATVLAVTTALVVVLQARGVQVAEAHRAAILGTTTDLTVAHEEAWRAEADTVLGAVGDLVVLRLELGGVLAVGLADGAAAWSYDRGLCYLVDLSGDDTLASTVAREPDRTRVVCERWAGSPSGGVLGADVLDPTTGTVVLEAPLVTSGGGYVTAWRDVLVSVGVDQVGRLIAQGWSMVTAERVWTWTGDVGAVPVTGLWRAQGLLAVETGGGQVALDMLTGSETEALTGVPSRPPVLLPDGGTVATLVTPEGSEVALSDPDGTVRATLPGGYYLAPAVDDPRARDVVPLYTGDFLLTGVDSRTGARLWTLGDRTYRAVGSLDDVLLIGYPVRAVEPRTGSTRWTSGSMAEPLSDGELVGLLEGDRLQVREPRTGDLVVSWPLPVTAGDVAALPGGRWALTTRGEIVVLAPV